MHLLDALGSRLSASAAITDRLFADGWGDYESIQHDLRMVPKLKPIDLEQQAPIVHRSWTVTDMRFNSPYEGLPHESKAAYVRLIDPGNASRVVVLMAAFNEHGYRTREAIAAPLLESGMAVAILENPYYGLRRPGSGQPLRTATDLLTMGVGAVHDALALIDFLRAVRPWAVGVAGYSMGANTAALVAAVSSSPLPCAALAASHSPGPVFTEGALAGAVDWDALGGKATALPRLGELFGQATVLAFDPAPHTRHAVILGITGDGYVPARATKELSSHWPGSELTWLPGGHASVLLSRKRLLAELIGRAFDRFEAGESEG